MPSVGSIRVATLSLAIVATILGTQYSLAEQVTVTLRSGRSLTGELDQRTSDEQLVLRFEGPSSRIWRPIAWDQIATAEHDSQSLSTDELRRLATRSASAAPPLTLPPAVANRVDPQQQALPCVVSLYIQAAMANWDADVEPDGVVVEAWPLDANGDAVEVDGTLEVELLAARPVAIYGRFVQTRGEPFPQLAYQSFTINRQNNWRNGSARVQLPFWWRNPQFDLSVATYGVVHARMSIPGHGTFEASADLVRIRSHSPTRDDLQQLTDRWYFPSEWTTPR